MELVAHHLLFPYIDRSTTTFKSLDTKVETSQLFGTESAALKVIRERAGTLTVGPGFGPVLVI